MKKYEKVQYIYTQLFLNKKGQSRTFFEFLYFAFLAIFKISFIILDILKFYNVNIFYGDIILIFIFILMYIIIIINLYLFLNRFRPRLTQGHGSTTVFGPSSNESSRPGQL